MLSCAYSRQKASGKFVSNTTVQCLGTGIGKPVWMVERSFHQELVGGSRNDEDYSVIFAECYEFLSVLWQCRQATGRHSWPFKNPVQSIRFSCEYLSEPVVKKKEPRLKNTKMVIPKVIEYNTIKTFVTCVWSVKAESEAQAVECSFIALIGIADSALYV